MPSGVDDLYRWLQMDILGDGMLCLASLGLNFYFMCQDLKAGRYHVTFSAHNTWTFGASLGKFLWSENTGILEIDMCSHVCHSPHHSLRLTSHRSHTIVAIWSLEAFTSGSLGLSNLCDIAESPVYPRVSLL